MKYGLNDEQWAAVSDPTPEIFCSASAGAGKTRCLIARIQFLLSRIPPENILAVTFTNKAAGEMQDRLKSHTDISKMQISTIHSLCVRIIRTFVRLTYLKMPFTIYDDGDQMSIIKTIVKSRDLAGDPYEYLSAISKSKADDKPPEDPDYLLVYTQYQEILKKNNGCDFDDLLVLARNCLRDNQTCRDHFRNIWKHILVDECQDTSVIQFEIINLLYNKGPGTLFMVGDQNQSVYKWRGARPENVDDFIKKYGASVHILTYNYRSCPDIISYANKFQQFGKPMLAKTATQGRISFSEFRSQEEEAEKIAQALLKMGNDYQETAIIYRVNTRSLLFEQTFSKYRIPYKVVADTPFYQRKVTKDLLSALKASNNPQDIESLSRIINNPRRGFGDAKREQLLLHGRSYVERVADEMPLIRSFLELLESLKGMNPSDALSTYLHSSGYRQSLTKDSDIYMVNALQDMVTKFDSVEELILASTFLENDSGRGVNLLTAHASKGLEFNRVFVVGVEQDLWPHKNSVDIEEEFRLYYVAVTRAKRYLNVSYSQSRNYRGSVVPLYPSSLFSTHLQ